MRSFQQWREEQEWGCLDGRRIPIKDITNGHLVNILNHMRDKGSFREETKTMMREEALYRKTINFFSLDGLPTEREDGSWCLTNPDTGDEYIVEPPSEYFEAVKKKEEEWENLRKELAAILKKGTENDANN